MKSRWFARLPGLITGIENKLADLLQHKKRKMIIIGLLIVSAYWFIVLLGTFGLSGEDSSRNLNEYFWGNVLLKSTMITFFILFGMYWIPVLFKWNKNALIKYSPKTANAFGGLLRSEHARREKYMVLITGGIIGLSLFIQAIAHSYTLYQAFDMEDAFTFICCYIYVFIYTFVSSAFLILIYKKTEVKQIKKIRRIAVIMCFLMLPAAYFIPMFVNDSYYYEGLVYVLGGIVIAPLFVIVNALTFFIIISVWCIIKKRTRERRIAKL